MRPLKQTLRKGYLTHESPDSLQESREPSPERRLWRCSLTAASTARGERLLLAREVRVIHVLIQHAVRVEE
jgi:hypothetical protein